MTRTILRLEQIAERTGVSIDTLRWYRHKGIGPKTWRLGRRVVAYEDDVDAWLEQQANAEGGDAA
jgi:excisionase family DNA binding protein